MRLPHIIRYQKAVWYIKEWTIEHCEAVSQGEAASLSEETSYDKDFLHDEAAFHNICALHNKADINIEDASHNVLD